VAAGVTSLCSSERSRGGTDGGLHCCSLLACFLVEEIREGRGPLACWLAVGIEEQREMEKWRMVLGLELLLAVLGMGEGRGNCWFASQWRTRSTGRGAAAACA
jgi:hypothetical protein